MSKNFKDYDLSTVNGNLGKLLHNYDEVDSTIRVVQKVYNGQDAFYLSMVPPPKEDELEKIESKLIKKGLDFVNEKGQLYITGIEDEEKFEEFIY